MSVIYILSGFCQYYFENKILYRKAYKIKMKNGNWQYRSKRAIKKTYNNGIAGYILIRKGKRKFYSLKQLKHRLEKL